MGRLTALAHTLASQGFTQDLVAERQEIAIVEHGEAALPSDIIRPDGTFDLYEDVQTKLEIEYKRRQQRLIVRGGGWAGYVPLNDRYALRIGTRVPVENLEQIISRTTGTKIEMLERYSQMYGHTAEKPQTLFDILTDQFVVALNQIWREGLAKAYREDRFFSSMPFGRIDPYRTALQQEKRKRPDAAFSAFVRTDDFGPNRILRTALERLNAAYRTFEADERQFNRIHRIRDALRHFEDISEANVAELQPEVTEQIIRHLPAHRAAYNDALRLAQLIVADVGFALRKGKGLAKLPVILVDMADIFESYAREALKKELEPIGPHSVLDGNISGAKGAKLKLFDRLDIEGSNPFATPDIVVSSEGRSQIVIDVKYKPAKRIPDRAEINQIICYGARYNCDKVMILYPERYRGADPVCSIGMVGGLQVFRGGLDLGAVDLQVEETLFGDGIRHVLS